MIIETAGFAQTPTKKKKTYSLISHHFTCIHRYTHIHTHKHAMQTKHLHVRMHAHTETHACNYHYICTHACTQAHTYMCMHTHMHVRIHKHMHAHAHTHTHTPLSHHTHTHTHTLANKHRKKNKTHRPASQTESWNGSSSCYVQSPGCSWGRGTFHQRQCAELKQFSHSPCFMPSFCINSNRSVTVFPNPHPIFPH